MEMLALTQGHAPVKTTEEAMRKQFEFWNTQPVPKIGKIYGILYCESDY